jgi:hypothetical protein
VSFKPSADLILRLREAAENLSEQFSPPIDLLALAKRKNVKVRVCNFGKPRLEGNFSGPLEVVVPTAVFVRSEWLTHRGRYLLAHELAHVFLMELGVPEPSSKSDYWKVENLADLFACCLLLPTTVVSSGRPIGSLSVGSVSAWIDRTSRIAQVPWFTAAVRVAATEPRTFALRLEKQREKEWKVVFSTLHNHAERGRVIPSSGLLSASLNGIKVGSKAEFSLTSLGAGDLRHVATGSTLMAQRSRSNEIKLVGLS